MPTQDEEEKHKYKRIETQHHKGSWYRQERTRIILLCSECGDIKVVDL